MAGILLPGDAGFADVLAGKHFCAGANYNAVGTMPNKTGAGLIITPSNVDQAIAQGYYPGGADDGKVAAVSFYATKLLIGTTVAGTPGTMPENGALNFTPSAVSQSIPAGHTSGGTVAAIPSAVTGKQTGIASVGAFSTLVVSISSVNMALSFTRLTNPATGTAVLTSSTGLTIRNYGGGVIDYAWEVMTLSATTCKGVQRGSIYVPAHSTTPISVGITPVNVNNSYLSPSDIEGGGSTLVFTDGSTLVLTPAYATNNYYFNWELVEFN
jgi:hypothetical protein